MRQKIGVVVGDLKGHPTLSEGAVVSVKADVKQSKTYPPTLCTDRLETTA
jgi:hypothetical protein